MNNINKQMYVWMILRAKVSNKAEKDVLGRRASYFPWGS